MKDEEIIEFLVQYDYDVRKTENARWIDQKCTPDNQPLHTGERKCLYD